MSIHATDPTAKRMNDLLMYMEDHPAPTTQESVVIPDMDKHALLSQMKWLRDIFHPALSQILKSVNCVTIDGNTQTGGKELEKQVEYLLNSMGIPFKKAGSQQPIDFREVQFLFDLLKMFLECKKADGTTIILNDSLPKRGSWYVVYSTKYGKLIIILADVLLEHCEELQDPHTRMTEYLTLQDYKRLTECLRHDFKSFGDFKAFSRMNLSINLRRYFDGDQLIFWDIHEDPPPDLVAEKKKQKEKEKYEFQMGKDIWRLFNK